MSKFSKNMIYLQINDKKISMKTMIQKKGIIFITLKCSKKIISKM